MKCRLYMGTMGTIIPKDLPYGKKHFEIHHDSEIKNGDVLSTLEKQ